MADDGEQQAGDPAETVPCRNCGTPISADARFCESCGAEQPAGATEPETVADAPTAETAAHQHPEPGTPPSGEPRAADFAQLLQGVGQLPGVQVAGLSALIGAGIVLAAGFLMAIALPDSSFLHLGNSGSPDLWRETLMHAATTTLATLSLNYEGGELALRQAPLLFVLFPVGGCALGAYRMAPRTATMQARLRLAWGAGTAVPFALLMLVISLLAGSISDSSGSFSPSDGSVVVLAFLWGACGGVLGTMLALRGQGPVVEPTSAVGRAVALARAVLRPLAISLLALTLIGTGVWVVQTTRGASEARGDRSVATALVDDVLYAGDYGLRYQALGSGAEFKLFNSELIGAVVAAGVNNDEETGSGDTSASDFVPIPISESKISDGLINEQGLDALGAKFRVFDYSDVLPAWAFAPLLLLLMAIPAFLALYGGFGAARASGAATPLAGAAWGAVVGPAWGIVLALLNTLTQDLFFGQIDSDSLFVITLLAGAALGALGGLGAVQQQGGLGARRASA